MVRGRLPELALPYCVDIVRRQVLFTNHDAAGFACVRGAAFMFGEQLATAVGVHGVSFEQLGAFAAGGMAPPLLVFSPGRTGSTLLVRVLSACGLSCASEPDVLTQLGQIPEAQIVACGDGLREMLARAVIGRLVDVLGGGVCIKLRSQANERPLVLAGGAAGGRVVFMLRRARDWAESRHRSFAEPPGAVAAVLRQAVDALDKLQFAGLDFAVLWFETLVADPRAAVAACAPGLRFDGDAVRAALSRDSQEGTMVSRSALAGFRGDSGFDTAFEAAWQVARAGAEWQPATEKLLAEMFAPN